MNSDQNSLTLVPKGPINNIPALVQILAWRRPGDKPLSEPMMARLPTHICVTWPPWINNVKSEQSDRRFGDDIFVYIFVKRICSYFLLKVHCSLFLMVHLANVQHWFKYWLGTDEATSHHLSQWWPSSSSWIYRSGLNACKCRSPKIHCYFRLE